MKNNGLLDQSRSSASLQLTLQLASALRPISIFFVFDNEYWSAITIYINLLGRVVNDVGNIN